MTSRFLPTKNSSSNGGKLYVSRPNTITHFSNEVVEVPSNQGCIGISGGPSPSIPFVPESSKTRTQKMGGMLLNGIEFKKKPPLKEPKPENINFVF